MTWSSSGSVPDGRAAIGLDLGGTKCLGLLVDPAGEVLSAHTLPSPGRRGSQPVIDTLLAVARPLVADAARRGVTVAGVGVGVPGLITRHGELRFAGHLGGKLELDLSRVLPPLLELPVAVDNDNTCAAYAEWTAGAAAGLHDVLFVGFGTGIGGGIVSGGALQRGANGFAGEIGHIGAHPSGPQCTCGRRGCWELFASGSALGRQAEEAIAAGRWDASGVHRPVQGSAVVASAVDGDSAALEILDRYASHVAAGLVDLTMVLDPSCIVLGGGVMTRHDVVIPLVLPHFRRLLGASSGLRPLPDVRVAHFGAQAGAIGAALLAAHLDAYDVGHR